MNIDENDFPACYIDSDIASKKAQFWYKLTVYAILIFLLLSAIYNALSSLITTSSVLPDRINGFILLVTAIASGLLLIIKPEKNWYIGRAVSESVKTLSWRFIMRAEPFQDNDDNVNRFILTKRLEDITSEANKSGFNPSSNSSHSNVITQKMLEIIGLDYLERKSIYATNRIEDQIDWYDKKSKKSKKFATVFGILLVVFQLIAAVYLYFFHEYIKVFKLHEIMIFLATTVISVIEMNKYKDLFQSYNLTKSELIFIRTRFGNIQNDQELNEFVLEAEQAISREHTMWLARRGNSEYLRDINNIN
jgi:hypothetical protein